MDKPFAYGIGIPLLLAGGGALWKMASFSGDLSEKWRSRVDLAIDALSERAAAALLRVQDDIADLVMAAGAPFEPLKVVEDPSRLREPIQQYMRLISARDRLRPRFEQLLRLGRYFLIAFGLWEVGVAIAMLDYGGVAVLEGLGRPAVIVAALALCSVVGLFLSYAYLQDALARSESLAYGKAR